MSGSSFTLGFYLGVFLECVMFGVFLPLFIAACYVQREKFSTGRGLNRVMVAATGFFGLTTTAHLVVGLHRAVGTVLHTPPGAAIHLTAGPPFPNDGIASILIFNLQATVTDIIVAYRIYHIYQGNPWVCIAPSVVILVLLADGCGLVHRLREPISNGDAVRNWSTAAFCLTIFNSTYTTSAISLRLWLVHRETVRAGVVGDSIILRAMRVLIESAALWTTFVSINTLLALAGSNLTYTFSAMSSPILGICFCLIIVRLGRVLPVAQEETWHTSIRTPSSRSRGSDHVSLSLPKVEIRQEVHVSDSKDLPMETLDPQNQEGVNSSDGSPKVFRPSFSLSAHK